MYFKFLNLKIIHIMALYHCFYLKITHPTSTKWFRRDKSWMELISSKYFANQQFFMLFEISFLFFFNAWVLIRFFYYNSLSIGPTHKFYVEKHCVLSFEKVLGAYSEFCQPSAGDSKCIIQESSICITWVPLTVLFFASNNYG